MIYLAIEFIFSVVGLSIIYYFIYIKLLSKLKSVKNFLDTPYPGNKFSIIALIIYSIAFAVSSILMIFVFFVLPIVVLMSGSFRTFSLILISSVVILSVIGSAVLIIRAHEIKKVT